MSRPGDVPNLTADPSVAERELGFIASRDFPCICRDLWNWRTKNPNGYSQIPLPGRLHPLIQLGSQVNWDICCSGESSTLGESPPTSMKLTSPSILDYELKMKGNGLGIDRDGETVDSACFVSCLSSLR